MKSNPYSDLTPKQIESIKAADKKLTQVGRQLKRKHGFTYERSACCNTCSDGDIYVIVQEWPRYEWFRRGIWIGFRTEVASLLHAALKAAGLNVVWNGNLDTKMLVLPKGITQ